MSRRERRNTALRVIILFGIWLAALQASALQPLARKLDSLVSASPLLQTSEAGIAVFNLTRGETVYAYHDRKLYRPASVEKVITAVTALAVLGTDHTFDTTLRYTGQIGPDSTLQGDLYVVGGFDPEFSDADLTRMAEAVHRAGIRRIAGRLVGDVSMKDSVYWGSGWSWDDTPQAFQPYLSPLMLNRGCVDVTVSPGAPGSPALVTVRPVSDCYRVENRASSRNSSAGKLLVTRDWLTNGNTIRVSGNVEHKQTVQLNLFDPAGFFLSTFRQRMRQTGVEVQQTDTGICPPEAVTLYRYGRDLMPVLKRALKKSDNLAAEALFYHLARGESGNTPAGWTDGQRAVYRFMREQLGRNPDSCRVVDGSGVSLYNYISPDLLLCYLKYAYAHPEVFRSLYDALPIAGTDGTLAARMKRGRAFGNVRAKTGTVTGVSSLAGYVHTRRGELLAFVIINQNVLQGSRARAFQNAVCELLAR